MELMTHICVIVGKGLKKRGKSWVWQDLQRYNHEILTALVSGGYN